MKLCSAVLLALAIATASGAAYGEGCSTKPGKARWAVKIMAPVSESATVVPLGQLIDMRDPPVTTKQRRRFANARMTGTYDNLKEGELIRTTGWLFLAKCSRDDGDYHIQISPDSEGKGGCLIVEVPSPDFLKSKSDKAAYQKVRDFIRSKFYGGSLPHANHKIVRKQIVVEGALFYDMPHYSKKMARGPGGGRGVKCDVRTLWEIHPVTSIRFAGG